MTEREIQKLFVDHPFGEAKRLLIEDIERSDYELTGNENVFELKAISTNCSRSQMSRQEHAVFAEKGEGTETVAGTGSGGNEEANGEGNGEGSEHIATENANADPGASSGSESSPEQQQTGQHQSRSENRVPAETKVNPSSLNGIQPERPEEGKKINSEKSEEIKNSEEKLKETFENEQNERQEQSQSRKKLRSRKQKQEQKQEQQLELPQNAEEEQQREELPKEKSEEEMEGEASELMRKAQELLKEAEKKREEKRKKEEEERRKREQEAQKNNRHYMTDEVVKRLKCLGKAFLVGPAGTGKSTLAMCACREIFGIEGPVEAVVKSGKFAQISFSPDTVSADMLGFTDVNGVFHETEIIRVFRDGGLILFDEMDDADASLLVKLNTMLANRVIPIPGGVVTQNEECYIVGTANTYGKGGNSMYVGRSRLDAATLDRWKMSTIDVDYDVKLEEGIISRTIGEKFQKAAKELTIATGVIRERIQANKWKQICSTRFVIDGCKMIAAGYSVKKVLDTYLLDWDDNSRRLVNSAIRDAFNTNAR